MPLLSQLLHNKKAMVGVVILAFIILVAVFANNSKRALNSPYFRLRIRKPARRSTSQRSADSCATAAWCLA